jgi:hypothetical protein
MRFDVPGLHRIEPLMQDLEHCPQAILGWSREGRAEPHLHRVDKFPSIHHRFLSSALRCAMAIPYWTRIWLVTWVTPRALQGVSSASRRSEKLRTVPLQGDEVPSTRISICPAST